MTAKIAIILGTRPEVIKLSPVIKFCRKNGVNYSLVHTNQHFSENMDSAFFEELDLPQPNHNLNINRCSHAVMTARMLVDIEKVLIEEEPDIVVVEGDTNTVMSGALCASKLGIKVGHVEAGLRSYDRVMPEEVNRVVTDHVSDFLFAPTNVQKNILLKEGVAPEKIFVVGNTIVDAVYENIKIAEETLDAKYANGSFLLLTCHREENVDNPDKVRGVFEGLRMTHERHGIRTVFPVHPRTKLRIEEFGIEPPECVDVIEPTGYLEFLLLQKSARLVLTDSGGVQEEACILKIPCVTLRENTERPETLEVGANVLVGTEPERIVAGVEEMLNRERVWENPFGDGKSGVRIMEILLAHR